MKIIVTNKLSVTDIPSELKKELAEKLTFPNPQWLDNDRMGRWNGNTPQYLRCYEHVDGALIIPRGFCRQLITMCRSQGIAYEIDDQRRTLPEVNFSFKGTLKDFQGEAVNAILKRDFGTLSAPTGSGKTVMALATIAERRQPALIVVHTKELMNQWIDRIDTFLNIPAKEVGAIGGGKKKIGDKITVALVQSLYKCADKVAPHIGFLVCDECHHCPSRIFTEAVTVFDSKYMLGLSATPWRRDKLSRLIFWHLGDLVHEVDKSQLVENGDILKAEVVFRETNYSTYLDASEEYSKMLSELTQDFERNRLIASDVAKEADNGSGVCLVLSDRKAHCETLREMLAHRFNTPSEFLTGDLSKTQREGVIDRLNRGRVKVLVSTTQLLSEGFDAKQLSTLFLTTPVKFEGRLIQCVGRVLRPVLGKDKAKVYDYVDSNIGVLMAAAKARRRAYRD